MSATLAVCYIVRNEVGRLAESVRSIADLADEIVVADTGSTDGTVALARDLSTRFLQVAWTEDFSAARNETLAAATADWILVLDADERLREGRPGALKEALGAEDVLGWDVEVENDLGDGRRGCLRALRLFRNRSDVRFRGRVHEQVGWSLEEIGRLESGWHVRRLADVTIEHEGYRPEVLSARGKRERNVRLLRLALDDDPSDPYLHYKLFRELAEDAEAAEHLARAARLLLEASPSVLRRDATAGGILTNAALVWSDGDSAEARAAARLATELLPRHPAARLALGLALAATGRTDRARRELQRSLDLPQPDDGPAFDADRCDLRARLALAGVLAADRRFEEALRVVDAARKRHPTRGAPGRERVRVLLAAGRAVEALREARAGLAARPDDSRWLTCCARAAEALGQSDIAARWHAAAVTEEQHPMTTPCPDPVTPLLTAVVVATGDEDLAPLLERLDRGTVAGNRLQIVVVALGEAEHRGAEGRGPGTVLLTEPGGSPARAFNLAVERASAPLLLLLDADARPAADLVEAHLAAHAASTEPTAVLGLGPAVALERLAPTNRLDDGLPLQVDAAGGFSCPIATLVPGRPADWRAFEPSNLSLPVNVLRAANGLDAEVFADGIGAFADLGYRLQRSGIGLRYHPEAACEHDDSFDLSCWLARRDAEGVAVARLWRKHADPDVSWFTNGLPLDDGIVRQFLLRCEQALPRLLAVLDALHEHGLEAAAGDPLVIKHLGALGTVGTYLGCYRELAGHDPLPVIVEGPTTGDLTSVIVLSQDALEMTRRCLERLRRHSDEDHPIEILVVDNGSSDGSRAWLEAQPDVELLANEDNVGAPIARNQALGRARGEWVVFLDNDALVGPGWLARLKYHAQVDPRAAFVGPVSNRAAHGQQVTGAPCDPDDVERAEAFARRAADVQDRRYRLNAFLTSFCMLGRREVLQRLGGFDPRFSPWGFEDDDITLRANLLGFHSRVALDVFVQHAGKPGERAQEHDVLLERNWTRFAAKWGLPPQTSYGRHEDVHAAASAHRWTDEELHVPLDAPAPTAEEALRPLPAAPAAAALALLAGGGTAEGAEESGEDALVQGGPIVPAEPGPRAVALPDEGLLVSVIVPTYSRPDLVENLLARLDAQSLPADAFEVIVVDDGSPEPVRVDPGSHGYALTLLRQENAGPAAARNLALTRCRAPLTLIFNDDAVPEPDVLAAHVAAHRDCPGHAVLGTFDFVEAVRSPFVRALQDSSLLFNFVAMRPDHLHPWPFFWTCNLSVATESLRRVGGFDEGLFREAIVEDVELGYRLEQCGVRVLFRPEVRCGHDHEMQAAGHFRRMVRLGVNLLRMHLKHDDPSVLWRPEGWRLDDLELIRLQQRCEALLPHVPKAIEAIERFEAEQADRVPSAAQLEAVRDITRSTGIVLMEAGILSEATGHDAVGAIIDGPPEDVEVDVVVVPDGRLDALERTLQSLTEAASAERPTRILVLDDGRDATTTALVAAGERTESVSVPAGCSRGAARNAGLREARSSWVAFVDPGVVVDDDWLRALLRQGWADGRVGSVAPHATLARHGLQFDPADVSATVPTRLELGNLVATAPPSRYQRLVDGQCLLVRREVVLSLGGYDEQLGSVTTEDGDLALRLHLAGWRNRTAVDVVVDRADVPSTDEEAWDRLMSKWDLPGLLPNEWRLWATNVERDVERDPASLVGHGAPVGAT